jgi:hypothetical protein
LVDQYRTLHIYFAVRQLRGARGHHTNHGLANRIAAMGSRPGRGGRYFGAPASDVECGVKLIGRAFRRIIEAIAGLSKITAILLAIYIVNQLHKARRLWASPAEMIAFSASIIISLIYLSFVVISFEASVILSIVQKIDIILA